MRIRANNNHLDMAKSLLEYCGTSDDAAVEFCGSRYFVGIGNIGRVRHGVSFLDFNQWYLI